MGEGLAAGLAVGDGVGDAEIAVWLGDGAGVPK